jgi:hypothetical protein
MQGTYDTQKAIRALLGVNISKSRPVTMLRARPHAIHFKPILDFGAGQDSAQQIIAEVGHRSPKGNRHVRRLLNQAANAAIKVKGSIFEVVYHHQSVDCPRGKDFR